MEAELAEQSHLRLQAAGESEFLKAELDDLRRVREDTEKEQRSLTEIESEHQYQCAEFKTRVTTAKSELKLSSSSGGAAHVWMQRNVHSVKVESSAYISPSQPSDFLLVSLQRPSRYFRALI